MYLKDFKVIRPPHEASQETLLEWIAKAHDSSQRKWGEQSEEFLPAIRALLFRLGSGKNKVHKRGFVLDDFNHENWDKISVYNIHHSPEGYQLDRRMDIFNQRVLDILHGFYPSDAPLPSRLVHVTCTGYVAPSPIQQLISHRGKGEETSSINAYHMGCYAAIPAIRMAMGHYATEREESEIVHTEVCSLHMNPFLHSVDQLIGQALFGDGFIKYTYGEKGSSNCLKVICVLDQILNDSLEKMTWHCNPWGFKMFIAKDIPNYIRDHIKGFLVRLAAKGGYSEESLKKAYFAIHPGGPKIIDQIADYLQLTENQIAHSKWVLQNYGNMSSGTIPHILDRMVKDPSIKEGDLIFSIAFGPGLSVTGALFEKR